MGKIIDLKQVGEKLVALTAEGKAYVCNIHSSSITTPSWQEIIPPKKIEAQ